MRGSDRLPCEQHFTSLTSILISRSGKEDTSDVVQCQVSGSGMRWSGLFHGLLLVVSLLLFISSYGQPQAIFKFENYFKNEGLPAQNVTAILQDSIGFLWVGTTDGLFRYDGKEFKPYFPSDKVEQGRPMRSISSLCLSDKGRIWVGTSEGLLQFNTITEQFTSYHDLAERFKFSEHVQSIYVDDNHHVWISTRPLKELRGALVQIDLKNGNCRKYTYSTVTDYTGKITEDRQGRFWIATSQGLLIFDRKRGVFVKHLLPVPNDQNSLSEADISDIFMDQRGYIWVSSYHNGLSRIEYTPDLRLHFKHLTSRQGLIDDEIMSMHPDREGRIWIATLKGLSLYHTRTEQIINLHAESSGQGSLVESSCTQVFEDVSGIIWIGHFGSGISKLKSNKGFSIFNTPSYLAKRDAHDLVTAIYEEVDGIVWAAFQDKGIYKLEFTHGFGQEPNRTFFPITNGKVWGMARDPEGRMWVGMERGLGAAILDESSKTLKSFNARRNFYIVRKDSKGRVWMSAGTDLFVTEPGRLPVLRPIKADTSFKTKLHHVEFSEIEEDSSGRIWVTSWQGPVLYFDESTSTLKSVKRDPGPWTIDLENLGICSMVINGDEFWLNTFNGLCKYELKKSDGQDVLELKDIKLDVLGRGSTFTSVMTMDHHGVLWLGQHELVTYKDSVRSVFGHNDGLPRGGMLIRSVARLKNGFIAMGTVEGLAIFHPDSLTTASNPSPVVFTSMKVDNLPTYGSSFIKDSVEQFRLDRSITYLKNVVIPYHKKVLTFEFAILDFVNPEKNAYAYKLDGFDFRWTTTSQPNVTYTNLSAGEYTLRVRASNHDGFWNANSASLLITIQPPPWKTWWAYSLYSISLIGILIMARSELMKREKLKSEVRIKAMESEKLKEIDQIKSRFFANISHEFRTPLTLMLAPLQKRRQEATDKKDLADFDMMYRSGNHLLQLVNQLLDLSKIEAGSMTLMPQRVQINAMVRSLVGQFASMAESRSIHFEIAVDDEIHFVVDPDKLEKVIVNLLSNAFKFTPDHGHIQIDVRIDQGDLIINVSDSGIGIAADKLTRIFDRFYQVDDSLVREYEGTGIGLALAKELVELHKGKLEVSSELGKGSSFTVRIPPLAAALTDGPSPTYTKSTESDEKASEEPSGSRELNAWESSEELAPRILIVEDNVDLRTYLADTLRSTWHVLTATNGQEGIDMAVQHIPDLILSDLMMPKVDGLELCRQLKAHERTSHIPIILVTAKADQPIKLEGLQQGADDYITKPFDITELKARIVNLIESRKRLRKLFSAQISLKPSDLKGESLDDQFMKKLLESIERHIADPLFGVDQLADEVSMSAVHLYRKVKALTGKGPNEVIREVRLERAASLLEQDTGIVADVAYQTGFNNLSYFAKCFREKFGETPSAFRKTRKSKGNPS